MSIEINNKSYQTNTLDFLLDYQDWDEDWVIHIALEEEIIYLYKRHLLVITFLQMFFENYRCAPSLRAVTTSTNLNKAELLKLFPTWPEGACRIAGLPNAYGCN